LVAKFPSDHGNCQIMDMGIWWENLHVEMKILPCILECNRAPSIYRWESRL
jgi:hypothetical protein